MKFLQKHFFLKWEKFIAELATLHFVTRAQKLVLDESLNLELKGGEEPHTPWTYQPFKEYFKETFGKVACSFLNSDVGGGTLYYGVHDSGIVQGISATREQRDNLRLVFDAIRQRTFDPQPSFAQLSLEWKAVENPGSNDELWLCEVKVRANGTLFWQDFTVWERMAGSTRKMDPAKIREKIQTDFLRKIQALKL